MSLAHTIGRVILTAIWLLLLGIVLYAVHYELTTNRLQAELLSRYAANLNYDIAEGANSALPFPTDGPYDRRLGYTRLPQIIDTLTMQGFKVVRQARISNPLQEYLESGGYMVYPEKTSAGLVIHDDVGAEMHERHFPTRTFSAFDTVPPLVVQTLLFIENRELLDTNTPYRNPAVEWDRFALAAIGQLVKVINPGINVGGGSTLATQIEKFRHSPEGRTGGIEDKLRQMFTASVRAYRHGALTMGERQRVVLDYLNSTPLTARRGVGEVNGLGDGLWAWFGVELDDVIATLSRQAQDLDTFAKQAEAYKQVLSLMLAQRRPSYYLITNRPALNDLANKYLGALVAAGIITPSLQKVAVALPLRFTASPQIPGGEDFVALKAANTVRLSLLRMLGIRSLYELDRMDANVKSTLNRGQQDRVIGLLHDMADLDKVAAYGMLGPKLLRPDNDQSQVIYSFVMYEATPYGNVVRIQADNLDKPLDLNESSKLELGSTAKLRTLATYLSAIADLYERYRTLEKADLTSLQDDAADPLTRFVVTTLHQQPKTTLPELLEAAMQRTYSASPGETFFTGGGAHTFVNFEASDNGRIVTLHEALEKSINLPFIRLMRDVVSYYIAQGPIARRDILGDATHPARQAYLARYADREGSVFLRRFHARYKGMDDNALLTALSERGRKTLAAQAVIYRSAKPRGGTAPFASFIAQRAAAFSVPEPGSEDLLTLYQGYGVDKYNLADRGYIAGVNPLELWLVGYMMQNHGASMEDILQASVEQRQETYSWLFTTAYRGAQDTRIRILLEQEAFSRIHDQWSKLGYPFERLVPSFATAIGSSGDRPGALAELMGIIVNSGLRLPTVRVEEIEFAKNTPYETLLQLDKTPLVTASEESETDTPAEGRVQGQRVMHKAVAATLRSALAAVVDNGTARRIKGALIDDHGNPVAIGGKTGTGDHRFEEFAPGGRVISSRAVARTATFVYYLGDKYFGTVTAHVEGEQADDYEFTSGLATQLFRVILSKLETLE